MSDESLFKKLQNKFRIRQYPTRAQWFEFIKEPRKIMSGVELTILTAAIALFFFSTSFLVYNIYYKNTVSVAAEGGLYIEGLIGQPRLINPIYAKASDVDRDLAELIFSSLFKYDASGRIIPDLAEKYDISQDGKIYDIKLKENILWSDGEPLNADDVVFTIKTIQDPLYKSPLQALWLGVEIEKLSDYKVRFTLKNPYAPFLESLTQKIMPKHIWQNITPENFPLSLNNLKPIGSGPYRVKDIKQSKDERIVSLNLTRNEKYFGKTPYITQISFRFYSDEEELINAYLNKEIQGLSLNSHQRFEKNKPYLTDHSFVIPRYFAVIFNPNKSKILMDKKVRQALNYGTDKKEIVESLSLRDEDIVVSPMLPKIYGLTEPSEKYQFNIEIAKSLLEEIGFNETEKGYREKVTANKPKYQLTKDLREGNQGKDVQELQRCLANDLTVYPEGTISGYFGPQTKEAVIRFQEKYSEEILKPSNLTEGTGVVGKATRDKINELCFSSTQEVIPLKLSLTTTNHPLLVQTANKLLEQWKKLGVEVEVKIVGVNQLEKDIIKQRQYEMLLFGLSSTIIPDYLPFWHSSQIKDPGLNLFSLQNKEVDKLLEEIRKTPEGEERRDKLTRLQNIILEQAPAVFLYSPPYIYLVSDKVKGVDIILAVDPSKRFSNIENWYIKTKRIWR